MSLTWMAWTAPTAIFFAAIFTLLAALTVLELYRPTTLRRGWLPFATTRGDRFFISLLIAAGMHIVALVAFTGPLWWVSAATLAATLALLRWG
ncbi:MAG: DUF2160 family membrane protein [Pseudomonadota bacterium]